jgi:hypothetical protein
VYLKKSLQPASAPSQAQAGGSAPDPVPFAGEYRNLLDHGVLSFTVSGGSLGVNGASLRSTGPNQFQNAGGATIAFDGSNSGMNVTIARDGEIAFTGARFERVHPGDADLAAYAGVYASKELDATYSLTVENGSLMLRNRWNPPLKLVAVVRDEFESDDLGTLVFQRDGNDRISGLSVFDGRIRNLAFEKIK